MIDRSPRSGAALLAWLRVQERKHGIPQFRLLKYMSNWGDLNEFGRVIANWSPEEADLGYQEAIRKLRASSLTPTTTVDGTADGAGPENQETNP